VKYIDWNAAKNEILKVERGISFEEVMDAFLEDGLIDVIEHPNPVKYSHQKMMILNVSGYVYLVPFVEDEEKVFLKTIIPSRKATKHYLIDLRKK
jgi:uncharacterized DUF497 family protein